MLHLVQGGKKSIRAKGRGLEKRTKPPPDSLLEEALCGRRGISGAFAVMQVVKEETNDDYCEAPGSSQVCKTFVSIENDSKDGPRAASQGKHTSSCTDKGL